MVQWIARRNGVMHTKIGSDSNNFLILKIERNWENPDLSSGMSSYTELDKNSYFPLKEKKVDFSICNAQQLIPHNPEQYGLNVIQELQNLLCQLVFLRSPAWKHASQQQL
jgi:N-acetylneuraminate synthase